MREYPDVNAGPDFLHVLNLAITFCPGAAVQPERKSVLLRSSFYRGAPEAKACQGTFLGFLAETERLIWIAESDNPLHNKGLRGPP